jgi:hypothetical protein
VHLSIEIYDSLIYTNKRSTQAGDARITSNTRVFPTASPLLATLLRTSKQS